jgi:single stranded DNA-binding protein
LTNKNKTGGKSPSAQERKMAGINNVVLTGRLKGDAEKRQTKDGGAFYTFTLYVDDYKLEDGKWRKTPGEIDIIVNESKAKGVESGLVKGALAGIEGRLAQRVWQGKDEKEHTNLTLRVQTINLLDGKGEAGAVYDDAEEIDAASLGL